MVQKEEEAAEAKEESSDDAEEAEEEPEEGEDGGEEEEEEEEEEEIVDPKEKFEEGQCAPVSISELSKRPPFAGQAASLSLYARPVLCTDMTLYRNVESREQNLGGRAQTRPAC